MNKRAICESLTCGRVLSNETFSGKTHNITLPKIENRNVVSLDSFVDTFKTTLNESCKGKDTIALALSGGKDSRVILGLLLELGIHPECVSWSYKETDPEVKVAKKICNRFQLDHKYIPIKPELYFNKNNQNKLLELADGSSLYFDMMLWYGIKDQLNHDVVFCGNLMTEYMDTAEYRFYEGNNVRSALLSKETITSFLTTEESNEAFAKLFNFYIHTKDENQVIVQRMLDRIVQYHVMRKFINWDYPMLNNNLLSDLFAFPLSERVGSKLTRQILKTHSPGLYNMPTGRSPFSLRYPLIMHQAYQKMSGRKISKGLEHLLPKYMEKGETLLNLLSYYDFLDENKLKSFLEGEKGRTYRIGQSRLLNLYKWTLYNEGKNIDIM